MTDNEIEKMVMIAIACERHGVQEWKRHCACVACGRIYADAKLAWDNAGIEVKHGSVVQVTPPNIVRDTACECGSTKLKQVCKWCFIQLERDGARVPVSTPANPTDEGN